MRSHYRGGNLHLIVALPLLLAPQRGGILDLIVPPILEDATAAYGLARATPTFASAFADLDDDGDDDLVVSNHGRDIAIYINDGGRFVDRSELLPRTNNDRHALTIFDLDGDGDVDIALATGGGGLQRSIGPGSASQIFANRLELGRLFFEDVSAAAGVGFADWRGRWFMPVPTTGGIDLYFQSQFRAGRPNLYLKNLGALRFQVVNRPRLTRDSHSEGNDTLLDFDRDGLVDLLTVDRARVRVFRGTGDGFEEVSFPGLAGGPVNSVAVGDLDRDLYPDVYLGGRHGAGDRILLNKAGDRFELHEALPHEQWTRSVAIVDLDANAWPDIVVQRGRDTGASNGERFMLMSFATIFERHDIPGKPPGQADDLVVGFVDTDVRPDLFLTNGWGLAPTNVGPYELLLNRTPMPYGHVTVTLEGAPPNTDALGAQVELFDLDGLPLGYRMLAPRGQAQDSSRLHFGVGTAEGPFSLRVIWRDGTVRVVENVAPGDTITVRQRDRDARGGQP